MNMTTMTLDDGRVFPVYCGKALSWSIGLYMTPNEAVDGYPKAKAVIAAMRQDRPDLLASERRSLVKGSFDRMFGHNARICLKLIDSTD